MRYAIPLHFSWNPLWKWGREHLNNVIIMINSLFWRFSKNLYYSQVWHSHSFLHDLVFGISCSYSFYHFLCFLLYFFLIIILIVLVHFLIYKNTFPSLLNSVNVLFCFFKVKFRGSVKSMCIIVWEIFTWSVDLVHSWITIHLCYRMFPCSPIICFVLSCTHVLCILCYFLVFTFVC